MPHTLPGVKALRQLSMKDIEGKDMAQQFELIGSKIGGLSTDTQKAAAASDFFGAKQGLLLVNLFKTENAIRDARETVGGLGESMDKWASGFGYINDMLGAIPIKVKQFFAAFVGNNIEDLTRLADIIKSLDLTNVGNDAGAIISTLSNSLKEGNFFETLWTGISAVFKKLGELLISIFQVAGQHLAKSIEDSLDGTAIGDYLGIGKEVTGTSIDPYTGKKTEVNIVSRFSVNVRMMVLI